MHDTGTTSAELENGTARRMIEVSKELVSNGMNRGASGNISVRSLSGDQFFITPSGIAPAVMTPTAICRMDMAGNIQKGTKPSSEWRIHRDIYLARPDIHAVLHTHSTFATILACMHREVPPFHYMIAVTGGNTIPCAAYALFGSQALSDAVLKALGNGYACLMAHHGMVAAGNSLEHAMSIAIEVESLCEQYWHILQTGEPELLTEKQLSEVHEKFKDYFRK